MITPGAQRSQGFQVSTGRGSAQSLTMSDVEAIQSNINSVQNVAPEQYRKLPNYSKRHQY